MPWRDNRQACEPANCLSALAGSLDGYAASVDNPQLGLVGIGLGPPADAQQRGELLAFVLIDLAAEGLDTKRFHDAFGPEPVSVPSVILGGDRGGTKRGS